jgi:alpha-amylase
MSTICFYFQVHQPYRIKKYRVFDIGHDHQYFDNHPQERTDNALILKKVMNKCYLPTNELLLKLLERHEDFKISFSLSGVFLKQIVDYAPEVVESFQKLVQTGQCEILAETYYHSLSAVYSEVEFKEQVQKHEDLIKEIFDVKPKVFRNTELIYSNDIAKLVEKMGYKGIITEGADQILQGKSPNQLFLPSGCTKIVALLKNYRLSDDIAFRFSDKNWQEHPLTADKYTHWLNQLNFSGNNQIINLFMDYETFGEHQWATSGIFDFLEHLPSIFLKNPNNSFGTPSEIISKHLPTKKETILETILEENQANLLNKEMEIKSNNIIQNKLIQPKIPVIETKKKQIKVETIDTSKLQVLEVPEYISWADAERDLSAWRSNSMQHEALEKIYSLENKVKQTKNQEIIEDWKKLTTSDHFYYMCTKFWSDGDVHKYFSPYQSPYEAFIYYMNVIKDLELRIKKTHQHSNKKIESYQVLEII